MRVQNDGDFDLVFDCADKLVCLERSHRACHILHTDGCNAHFFELFCKLCKRFESVDGALRIADCAGNSCAALDCRFGCGFEIAHVVERVENTNDVDAVVNGFFNEHLDDFVGIMLVAEKVLTSEQHLKFRVGHSLTQITQTLPRIFVEIPQTHVENRTAPALDRVITGFVHCGKDVGKFRIRQARSNQRLVCVAEHRFCKKNFLLSKFFSHLIASKK